MASEFDGRRVVVTGGSGFLGSAVVRLLADAGAQCEVTWHSESEGRHLPTGSRVRTHRVEAADESAVERFYAQFEDLWASIHVVGAFAIAPLAETSADAFGAMFRTNALTCFLCCRESVKAMRRSPGTPGGRIVNVGARPAVVPTGGMIAYSTSKGAVASITTSLAEELKPEDILVNAVLPSTMDTPANRKAMPDADFTKWPKVEEVARAIAFLASPANALTSGALVPVYGKA